MQTFTVSSFKPNAAIQQRPKKNSVSAVVCMQQPAVDRRRLLPLLIASIPLVLPLLTTPQPANAIGRDPRQLLKEKEARKAKLREAAAAMKAKGITEDAFKDSKYALPEEARTPNLRTLSDERLRKEQ